jgi:hypothetical protein
MLAVRHIKMTMKAYNEIGAVTQIQTGEGDMLNLHVRLK